MQVGPIARHDLAACLAARKSVPAPVSVPAPPAPHPRADYATFLQTEGARRDAERFTYSDVLEARRLAIRAAAQTTQPTTAQPVQSSPLYTESAASNAALETTSATPPAKRRAIDAPYRVSVETLTYRGSLIDILL